MCRLFLAARVCCKARFASRMNVCFSLVCASRNGRSEPGGAAGTRKPAPHTSTRSDCLRFFNPLEICSVFRRALRQESVRKHRHEYLCRSSCGPLANCRIELQTSPSADIHFAGLSYSTYVVIYRFVTSSLVQIDIWTEAFMRAPRRLEMRQIDPYERANPESLTSACNPVLRNGNFLS